MGAGSKKPGVASARGRGPYARQLALFLLTVLLPAGSLILLSWRAVAQERELSRNRARDERERAARHFGQELLSELERLTGARRPPAADDPGAGGGTGSAPDVVMVGRVRGGALYLPWERDAPPPAGAGHADSPFDRLLWDAEHLELARADLTAAASPRSPPKS